MFGVYLIAFRFRVLLVAEMVLISMGPILFAGLGIRVVAQRLPEFISRLSLGPVVPSVPSSQTAAVTWATLTNSIAYLGRLRGFGRFWLALILGTGAQVGLVVGFLRLNPNVCNFLYL